MAPLSFLVAAAVLAAAFLALGAWTGRRVRSAKDFALAGRSASAASVTGVLLGALVGGASTVGTAEMAYRHGLSACWFTVGGGLGCLLLGLWLAHPLRASGKETIPELLRAQYGRPVAALSVVSTSLGSFLSVVAQVLCGLALLQVAAPLGTTWSVLLLAASVLGFAWVGGLRSFAALGTAKIALLYVLLLACAGAALVRGATPGWLWQQLPSSFFNPVSLGVKDLGAATSLVVGVLCTQIYVQALFSSRDEHTARVGALASAALMPPLGLAGIWVGLQLRASGVEIAPAQALPHFLRTTFPAPVAGALWGIVLLTTVGTAAGVALGIAQNLARDVWARLRPGEQSAWPGRVAFLLIVGLAATLASLGRDTPILHWSYLAMGLRGAGTFFPLVVALLAPGRLPAPWALAASASGLAITLAWPSGTRVDPLLAGLWVSGLATAVGLLRGRAVRAG